MSDDILSIIKEKLYLLIKGSHVKYSLKKDFKPKNINNVTFHDEVVPKIFDIDLKIPKKFLNYLLDFIDVLMNNFSKDDLYILYNNLNNLKIKEKNLEFLISMIYKASALYYIENNCIIVSNNYYLTIFHELFHMASSFYENGICYSGFMQSSKINKLNIGYGMSEGYTQLLTERYFYNRTFKKAYSLEVHLMDKLEKIVGKDKLEKLYLKADLKGLICELNNYATEEDISKFIIGMDFVNEYSNHTILVKDEANMMKETLKNIYEFLIKAYIFKLEECLKNSEIDLYSYIKYLSNYIITLIPDIAKGYYNYNDLTREILKENLDRITSEFSNINAKHLCNIIK